MVKKRIFALLAAAAMSATLFGCGSKDNEEIVSSPTGGSVFSEPVSVSVMLPQGTEHFREDWKVWEYIEQATGAELDLLVVSADYETKLETVFASPESAPDLVVFNSKSLVDHYASQGALIAVEDIESQLPNWKSFWEKIPAEEKNGLFRIRRSADGKTYWPSRYGFTNSIGIKSWMYRRDIFEQHGLEVPTTYDELFKVAQKLKQLYPDSYPISFESFFGQIAQSVGPQWKPYFEYGVYYDFENNEWCYGAIEDTMLDMIKVFKEFFNQGLIPWQMAYSTSREFDDLVTTGGTFIFPHDQAYMPSYQASLKTVAPSFELAPMVPPVANDETGTPYMTNYRIDSNGLAIVNTGDQARMSNAISLFDWFYSDEAYELLSWGKEGETYQVVNDNKRFILSFAEDVRNKFGFQTPAAGQALDPNAVINHYFSGVATMDDAEIIMHSVEKKCNPKNWIPLTSDEQEVVSELGEEIRAYVEERIGDFLLGRAALSEWGSFVETVEDMDIEELLSVYENAYNRVK